MAIEENPHLSNGLDIRQYLSLLWHWAWLIILATAISGLTAYFVSKKITPIYQAKTTILINANTSNPYTDYSTMLLNSQLTQTYSQMIMKDSVLAEVSKRLGYQKIESTDVNAQQITSTQLITLTVDSTNPQMAATIANTIVAVFSDQIRSMQETRYSSSKQSLQSRITDLEAQIYAINDQLLKTTDEATKSYLLTKITNIQASYTSLLQSYETIQVAEAQTSSIIVQVDPATPPEKSIKPRTLLNVALAGASSLIIAMLVVYLVNYFDDTLKTATEFSEKLGLPILGSIPHHKIKDGIPVVENLPRSLEAEAFRTLRTNLQFAGVSSGQSLRAIMITSTNTNEGKTTVLVNLGVVLAQNNMRVTIVDADLRRPAVHDLLHLANKTGLSQAFLQQSLLESLDKFKQMTRIRNLYAITSGRIPPNPLELLGSVKMKNIVENVQRNADIVLVDTPPALTVSDAIVLLPLVQGVILVMKPGTTRFSEARQLIDQLRNDDANVLGIVLNDVKKPLLRSKYYYYHEKSSRLDPLDRENLEERLDYFAPPDITDFSNQSLEDIDSQTSINSSLPEINKKRGRRKTKVSHNELSLEE